MKNLETKITELVHSRMSQLKKEASHSTKPQENIPADMILVQEMIRKAILKYDADKTGEADFALESAGKFFFCILFFMNFH